MNHGMLHNLLLALLIGLLSASATAESTLHYRVEISTLDTAGLMRDLESKGFDVAGRDADAGTVEVIVSATELRLLVEMGFLPRIKSTSGTGRSIPPGYRDFDTIMALLEDYQNNYPAIARDVDVGAYTGMGNTFEGRPLRALKISDNVNEDEDEPAIMIVSCHHSREIVTPELALHAIEQLLTKYGLDPEITRMVDENEIWIAPVWNPDGYNYCFTTEEYWRKNRTDLGGGYFGIDLNRNYPYNWDGPGGGDTFPGSDTYRGPFEASEQETQNMIALALDRRFAKVLDFHNFGREVLYTYYDPAAMPPVMENYFFDEAQDLSTAMGYSGAVRKPSAEGEHFEWQLNELGAYSFLAETGDDFQPLYLEALAEAQLVWPGIKWFINHEIPLKGHITETKTGDPIAADIEIAGIVYPDDDKRRSGGAFGRFHYYLPPGTYEVTISADSYLPRIVTVTIVEGKSTILETQLGNDPALTLSGNAYPGETLDISFDYPAGAGQYYFNGISKTNQGFFFQNGVFFPIGKDKLLRNTAGSLPEWQGPFDGSGHASAALNIPNNPNLAGKTFYMAYLTYVIEWRQPTNVSAAVTLRIEP